ncbi:MAG: hypothetical protein J6U96_04865 [Elusimicrobiaceae bacterium]|nr:hypothetical protein [Elusimicrobiaceae bacterium]
MKRYLFPFILIAVFIPCALAQEADEIVIEMQGDSATAAPHPAAMLWNYNTRQLTQKWRGKTREQLLYAVPVVSDRDGIVRGAKAEYMLVEYFTDGQFRKFLFKAETPQTFIAVAATPADALAINKKYGINIGLTQADFESAYGKRARLQSDDNLPENTALYQMMYSDINTPTPQKNWFLFENKKLTQTFYTQSEKDAYLNTLKTQNEQAAPKPAPAPKSAPVKQTAPQKALVWGGTTWDQAYMPKVVNPNPDLVFPHTSKK